jgi:hypothetical protein
LASIAEPPRPAVGERPDAVDQVLAADRVEDDVGAAAVGQLARALDEVLGGVVDPAVETELLEALELLVAGRGRDHGGTGLLGELDRGHPDAAPARVNQGRLPGLEVAGGEQALLGGPERHRDTRGATSVQPVGDRPGDDRGNGPLRGVRARREQGHDPVADRAILDPCTHLSDRARGEVAHDVRNRRRRRLGPRQQIPTLDADRLDQHATVGALGIGDVLVAQDVRGAVLVDNRRFHGGATLFARRRPGRSLKQD